MSGFWGWVSSIPGLFSALWGVIKSFFTFELGEEWQRMKAQSDALEKQNKQFRKVLDTGNDVYLLSESEIVKRLNQRGQLRDLPDLQTKGKPD